MTDARYSPKAGSLPHRVITFLVMNPDEELTRSDIAVKFDCNSSSIDTQLSLAVVRGVLGRKRNSEMEVVWCLGQSTNFVLDQAPGEDVAPTKLPARCYPSVRGTVSDEDSGINSLPVGSSRASPFPTAPPVILNLGDIQVRKGVRLLTKEERRREEFAEWFKQFGVGDSAEFDDIHFPTIKSECARHMRATKQKFRFAETGPGRQGVERVA